MARCELGTIYVERILDEEPDLSWLGTTQDEMGNILSSCQYGAADIAEYGMEQVQAWIDQDNARLESYGELWYCVGVRARVDVVVSGTVQQLQSGGLWGIESDSSDDYFAAVAAEQVAELRDICAELGVAVNAAWEWVE